MAISFNNIPSNIRVPLFYGEIDNSQANTVGVAKWNALLIGQMLDDASATENVPIAVSQASQANATFGRGSQMSRMVTAFRNNCPTGQLYCIPTKVKGEKAKGRVYFKGTATEGGYINLYVASDRVRVLVSNKTEAVQIAHDAIDAINAIADLPVTASKATSGAEATSGILKGGVITSFEALNSVTNGSLVFNIDDSSLIVNDVNFAQYHTAASEATSAKMVGKATGDNKATIKAISDGSIKFNIDNKDIDVQGLNFSAATSEQQIADVINAKLQGKATLSWKNDHYELVATSKGKASTIKACVNSGSGTAIAVHLKLDGASSPTITNGADAVASKNITAENICEALNGKLQSKATVTYQGDRFIVTSATQGKNSKVLYCTTHSAGTDVSATLKLDANSNGTILQGNDAEDISAAIDIECKGAGDYGNDIILQTDLRGAVGGEKPVNGVGVKIQQMQGGVGQIDVDAIIATLGDTAYDFIGVPFSDSDSLDKMALEMSDMAGRWSYARALFGHVLTAKRGQQPDALNALVDFGNTRNDQHCSVLGLEANFASASYDVVGALTGLCATNITIDSARPLQSLTLEGIVGAPLGGAFDLTERNTLLLNGIACQNTQQDRSVTLNRLITTYRVNTYGDVDTSYLDSERLWQLSYIQRVVKTSLTSKYPRHKLASDGTRLAPGQAVVTPSTLKAEVIGIFYNLEEQGIVESVDAWKGNIIVERNKLDSERVDMLIPCDLMNGLRVIAEMNQFRA